MIQKPSGIILLILFFIGFVVLMNSIFIVKQTEQAIVLEFGKPVKFTDGDKEVSFISSPGLKFKIPFIQDVKFFDNRILNFDATDKEVLDSENKALTVNAFAKYKIINPLTFYRTVTDDNGVNAKMERIFEASLRDAIGNAPLSKLLTEERKSIMRNIKNDIATKAKSFGIEVFDVRIVRADLPKENSEAIYKRMQAEREKEAREYRAQGEEEAKIIRAKADKEVKITIAEAEKKSQIIKGEGDAEATKIFANAFNRDPDFFNFYRTMQAYHKTIKKDDTKLILSPDSEFLKYFGDINGGRRR